ncbi:MAG: hypothetical protein IPP14_12975 [Planctomycetes bacterium]|nr:hypothetical protein [Planctomycetota bacterium]
MKTTTICLLLALLCPCLMAQAGGGTDSEAASRIATEKEEAAKLGANIVHNLADAKALPEDVAAVFSLDKLDDSLLLELKKRKSLKVLAFSRWRLGDEWVSDASLEILASFPALEELHLTLQEKFTSKGAAKLAGLKTLKQLRMSYCQPLEVSVVAAFKKHSSLAGLALPAALSPALMAAVADIPELRWLEVQGAMSGDNPFKDIDKCKKLEHLGLENSAIATAALAPLAKHKTLKSLRLGMLAVRVWTDDLLLAISKIKGLETLNTDTTSSTSSATAKGFEKLGMLKNLKSLAITYDFAKSLTPTVLKALLASLPALTSLELRYQYEMPLETVSALAERAKLTRLVFANGGITDTDFKAVLGKCTALEHLEFNADGLSEDVAVEALQAAPGLKEVVFWESERVLAAVPGKIRQARPEITIVRNPY